MSLLAMSDNHSDMWITRQELSEIPTPHMTSSHIPIPHTSVLEYAEDALNDCEYEIQEEKLLTSHEGQRFFALLTVRSFDTNHNELELQVAVRNSHDKSIAAGMALGYRVMICSNLQMGGEYTFSRKHTRGIQFELPGMVLSTMRSALPNHKKLYAFYDRMKQIELRPKQGELMIIESVRRNIIPPTKVMTVIDEFHEPSYDEFKEDGYNMHRWMMAFTSTVLRPGTPNSMMNMPVNTIKLNQFVTELTRDVA